MNDGSPAPTSPEEPAEFQLYRASTPVERGFDFDPKILLMLGLAGLIVLAAVLYQLKGGAGSDPIWQVDQRMPNIVDRVTFGMTEDELTSLTSGGQFGRVTATRREGVFAFEHERVPEVFEGRAEFDEAGGLIFLDVDLRKQRVRGPMLNLGDVSISALDPTAFVLGQSPLSALEEACNGLRGMRVRVLFDREGKTETYSWRLLDGAHDRGNLVARVRNGRLLEVTRSN